MVAPPMLCYSSGPVDCLYTIAIHPRGHAHYLSCSSIYLALLRAAFLSKKLPANYDPRAQASDAVLLHPGETLRLPFLVAC